MLKRITRLFAEIAIAAEQSLRGRPLSGAATAFRDACLGYMRWDSGIIPHRLDEISRKVEKTSDPEKLAKLRKAATDVTRDFGIDRGATQQRLTLHPTICAQLLNPMWDSDRPLFVKTQALHIVNMSLLTEIDNATSTESLRLNGDEIVEAFRSLLACYHDVSADPKDMEYFLGATFTFANRCMAARARMRERSNVNDWVIQEMTASLLDIASHASQRGDQKTLQWVNNVDHLLHRHRPLRNPDARLRSQEQLQAYLNRTPAQQAEDMLDTYRYEIATLTGRVNPAGEARQEAALDQSRRAAAEAQRFADDVRRQLDALQNPRPPSGRVFGFPDPFTN